MMYHANFWGSVGKGDRGKGGEGGLQDVPGTQLGSSAVELGLQKVLSFGGLLCSD